MKKTLNINLAGQVFTIDEDAYQKLNQYLQTLTNYYHESPDKEEILRDIELSIAEHFTGKTSTAKQSIGLDDVVSVIQELGTVEDFQNEDTDTNEEKKKKQSGESFHSRRLYRSADDKILGGVASGIGSYFDVDPVFIRIIFVLLTFAWGFAIVLYIILWIVTPEAVTPSEKAAMKGEPLTLKEIEAQVKTMVEEGKTQFQKVITKERVEKTETAVAHGLERFFQMFRSIIGNIMKALGGIVRGLSAIIGAIFIGAAILGIIALSIVSINLILNQHSPLIDLPIITSLSTADIILLTTAAALTVLIPLIFLIQLGVSLIKKKATVHLGTFLTMIVVWGIGIAFLIYGAIRVAPTFETIQQRESNSLITKQFDLDNFSAITASGAYTLEIHQGNSYSITVNGTDNQLKHLNMHKNDTELSIQEDWKNNICFFCSRHPVDVTITMPTLEQIDLRGASVAAITGFTEETLEVESVGASHVSFSGDVTQLKLNLKGASSFAGYGQADTITMWSSGASKVDTSRMPATSINANLFDASDAIVIVTESLIGELTGASRLKYVGTPTTLSVETSGTSRVEQISDSAVLE